MDTTANEAAQVVALMESGMRQCDVARQLNLSRFAVRRVFQRYQETGGFIRRHGSGRQRCTTDRDDRFIVSTPATGPKLTAQHRKERLHFAREHFNWTLDQWKTVLFSDETRVCLYSNDKRRKVYRRQGERFAQACTEETVEYGGGSCMFWGGISIDSKTELVCVSRTGGARVQGSLTSDRYITEILEEHVVPYAGFVGDGFILMHDNARSHTALIVKNYTEEVGIPVMNWPARSPDLNPIEHLWDELKRRVRSHDPAPTTLQDLQYAVVAEWVNIPQERIVRLITSMKDRMEAVIKARGSSTRF
ncbi:Ribonuclease H-like domain,Winged helix-turn-helix DNA-binding domain,Homeobox domain-like,Paired [Cinara cedri]|uniref:Ribonuclease H-like domain,Winged helix-turn-helix DNA-binding domain,Homeobox domain-like,Paired n=1 Tax=Cinara cedri TaxID=506608 RepID=A0A5E4MIA1_9HEMI|nr:Ribonuclease H-like domain,Winged helix-turn-helix DNA-binding domain,Homeobox domain-like,Paired [Cinara cedri]